MTAPLFETVFLDRDGTINRKPPEGEYVTAPEQLVLAPGAAQAVAALNRAALRVLVVTNQRGIALGRMSEQDLADVHGRLQAELARAGARIDAFFHCPHERDACSCRKPGTGLLEQARRTVAGVDFGRSVLVGDAASDMQAADRVAMPRVLLDAPDGVTHGRLVAEGVALDHVAGSLAEAVPWILARARGGDGGGLSGAGFSSRREREAS